MLERVLDAKVRPLAPPSNAPHDHVDVWFDLVAGGNQWRLAVERKSSPGKALERIKAWQRAIRSNSPDVVPLLAIPRLSHQDRERLKDEGINHLDLSGAIWIRAEGLFVQSDPSRDPPVKSPRDRGRNPFSKKASLVARALLEHPSRVWRVRDLSEESALSVGYSSEILRAMVAREYAAESAEGFRLSDPVSLLSDWAAKYRWEDNEIHSFVAPFEKRELVEKVFARLARHGVRGSLALLAAMDRLVKYVEHDQVHIYVADFPYPVESALGEALHAERGPVGGNLHVMKAYYGPAAWYGSQEIGGRTVVSDVQLFLDLIHYPVRGPEAADVLLRKRLGPRLGLNKAAASALRSRLGL